MSLQHPFGIIPTYIKPANVGSGTDIATLPSVNGVKCAQWFGDRRAIVLFATFATVANPIPFYIILHLMAWLGPGGVEPPGDAIHVRG